MAQRQFEAEHLLGIRDMLENVLHCLDEAGLNHVAIHVDMALNALDREHSRKEGVVLPNAERRTAASRTR